MVPLQLVVDPLSVPPVLAVGTGTKNQEKSSWYRIRFSIQMSVLNTDVGAWYCLAANCVFQIV